MPKCAPHRTRSTSFRACRLLETSAADSISRAWETHRITRGRPWSTWGQASSYTWPSLRCSGANKSMCNALQLLNGLCLSFLLQGGKEDRERWISFLLVVSLVNLGNKCKNSLLSLPVAQVTFLNITKHKKPLSQCPHLQLHIIFLFTLLNIFVNRVMHLQNIKHSGYETKPNSCICRT